MQYIRQNWDHVRQKRGGAKRSVSDAEAELGRTWVCVGWSFVRCWLVASLRPWLGKVGEFAEQGMCQTQGSRLVCVARSPSTKCVVCQPQGCTVCVAQLGNNQRYNSVGCRFQSRNPTARSQEQRGRMAACRTQTRTLNSTTHRTQGRKVGRDDGGRKVGCSQGWQGLSRKVARSDWVFARSANQSQDSIAKAGR